MKELNYKYKIVSLSQKRKYGGRGIKATCQGIQHISIKREARKRRGQDLTRLQGEGKNHAPPLPSLENHEGWNGALLYTGHGVDSL